MVMPGKVTIVEELLNTPEFLFRNYHNGGSPKNTAPSRSAAKTVCRVVLTLERCIMAEHRI